MPIPRPIRDQKPAETRLRTKLGHVANDQAGQSLVEFALCLPVLLVIVTGVLSFGIAINNFLLLTDSTNVAARQLAISRGNTTDPCALTSNALVAAAPTLKSASFALTLVLNGTTYSGNSCSSSSTSTGAPGNMVQGTTAKVTATYPCSLTLYGVSIASGCTLTAQTAELVQ